MDIELFEELIEDDAFTISEFSELSEKMKKALTIEAIKETILKMSKREITLYLMSQIIGEEPVMGLYPFKALKAAKEAISAYGIKEIKNYFIEKIEENAND